MARYLFTMCVIALAMFPFPTRAQDSTSQIRCADSGCHLGLINLRFIHPVVEDDCLTCHIKKNKEHPGGRDNEFTLVAKVPELCYQCHEIGRGMKHKHVPVAAGECCTCHNEHGAIYENLLKEQDVCINCHEMDPEAKFVHGPVAGKMCNACHDPHMSDHKDLLITGSKEICLFCHEAKKQIQEMQSVHAPFREDCMDCHNPHFSSAKYLLIEDVPGMCFACHEQVEVDLKNKSEVHGPFQEGNKCYLCHNAHVSKNDYLLQDEEKKLCFSCHNKKIQKGDRIIKNIEERVLDFKVVHAPVEGAGCSSCHAAHTPDNFFLLADAFPKGSYAEGKIENFAHCFDCHETELFTDSTTTAATNFRDADRNLHFVHLNREKARNCTTCHETHGTSYPHLIVSEVPFGKWNMPMSFKQLEDGGSCLTGCHKELNYHRNP